MFKSIPTASRVAAAVCVSALLGACASDRPDAELASARTLIAQAEQAGAQRYAQADLDHAREQLKKAEDTKDTDRARQFAQQAAADAELAAAKVRQGKAEESAQSTSSGVDTLKQEAQRNVDQTMQQPAPQQVPPQPQQQLPSQQQPTPPDATLPPEQQQQMTPETQSPPAQQMPPDQPEHSPPDQETPPGTQPQQ